MQKFLVIQTAFIGDAVLATGVIEKLHQFYPKAKIDFLVRKGNEGLFAMHPFVSELLVWNKKENKYTNLLKVLGKIRRNKYDVVVNLQRFSATGMLTVFSKAKKTIGFNKNPWSFLFSEKVKHQISTSNTYIHEVDRNQKLIENITDPIPAKPRLYPSPEDFEKVKDYQQHPYVCIAPASVWFTKQYPKEKWINLITKLPPHLYVYLLGAPTDKALCEEIRCASFRENVVNLAGKLSFLQSVALQSGAKMNYVNDSAPMHFASAVDAPVTAIYCSTVPSFGFGPLSNISNIVQTREPLTCKPCGLHGYKACPLGHFKCALTIEDEQLLQHLNNQKENIRSL